MDVTVTPETYTPSVDDNGNYIDNISTIKHGLFCPCGSRKDKSYENTAKFATHIKSKAHQKWLTILNQNKANYYVEALKNKELVVNQQKIITQLTKHNELSISELKKQLETKTLTIDYLTNQITTMMNPKTTDVDLLDIN